MINKALLTASRRLAVPSLPIDSRTSMRSATTMRLPEKYVRKYS